MSSPFIGEIRIFAGNFAPAGWAFCDGSLLAISQFDALFILIGTTYGGDGQTTFALPDLRGRLPIHQGNGFLVGESGGAEEVTLTTQQIPAHTHPVFATAALASTGSPGGNVAAQMSQVTTFAYGTDAPPTSLQPSIVAPRGGSQPHSNLQPFLCVNFIIALEGLFPTQG
jgi:microcystin-dependent protein